MLALIILSTLTGAVLGVRFKVFILVPASILVAAVTLTFVTAHGNGSWSFVFATLLAITALQVGYLAATVTRFVTVGTRLSTTLPKSSAAVQN
jgi:hypothetical protein